MTDTVLEALEQAADRMAAAQKDDGPGATLRNIYRAIAVVAVRAQVDR